MLTHKVIQCQRIISRKCTGSFLKFLHCADMNHSAGTLPRTAYSNYILTNQSLSHTFRYYFRAFCHIERTTLKQNILRLCGISVREHNSGCNSSRHQPYQTRNNLTKGYFQLIQPSFVDWKEALLQGIHNLTMKRCK